jgi:ligand-binding sensor domain-containing protein
MNHIRHKSPHKRIKPKASAVMNPKSEISIVTYCVYVVQIRNRTSEIRNLFVFLIVLCGSIFFYIYPLIFQLPMTIRLLIILLVYAIPSQAAIKIALTEKELTLPPYRQFTLRDGLPQMQVISMLQDSRGYIWIGTKSGLACYNGEKFVNFTRKNGLADDYIHGLAEDFIGNIWFSTSLGLACFDGKEIMNFPYSEKIGFRFAPASDGKIWYIGGDPRGKILFGYLEKGKYISRNDQLPSKSFVFTDNNVAFSKRENAVQFTRYPYLYELREGKIKAIGTFKDSLATIKSLQGRVFYADIANRFNLKLYEYVSGKLFEVARVLNRKLAGKPLLRDTVSFTTDGARSPIITITPDTFLLDNTDGIQKNCFIIDRNRNVWIGSEEGLFQIHSPAFRTFKKDYLPQVWAVTEDKKSNIWFSSFNFGMKRWDGKSLQSFPETTWEPACKFLHFRPSINHEGTLFFPGGYGIVRYDGKSFRKTGQNPPYLTTFYDKERELLWAGGYKRTEVYDRQNRLVRTVGSNDSAGMQRYYITINKDNSGNIWMGGSECLTKYRWETGEIVHYTRKNGKLPFEKVMTIYNDPYKRMWLGSTDGLFWYDVNRDSICKVNHEELSGSVNLISAIDSSWLIVSQPFGIYLMDLITFGNSGEVKLYLFNSENGFQGIEPGQDGAFTDSKGCIWMTSGTEVVRLDPKKLKMSDNMLKVRFSKCNGQSLLFDAAQFRLPSNDQTVIVEFDAICFNRPNPVQYSWKASNNAEWSPWQESNYVVLSGLTDGKKLLHVRARVPGLPLPEFASASLTLQVNLTLYKQTWFFPALFGLIVLLALFVFVMLLRTRIRMNQATRQSKVFQVQAIQSQMNPHFIFNALASLQTMILSVNVEKANDYLVKLAGLIRGFLESSVSTGNSGTRKEGNGEILINEELETLGNYVSFQQLIYPGRFDYNLNVDSQIDPMRYTIPPMLIQPFVENAIRHGLLPKKGPGILKVTVCLSESRSLVVEIADNGIGIEKAGTIIKDSPFRYVSRGRELTLNRIRLMNETGYHIKINTSSSDEGTTVTLEIEKHDR